MDRNPQQRQWDGGGDVGAADDGSEHALAAGQPEKQEAILDQLMGGAGTPGEFTPAAAAAPSAATSSGAAAPAEPPPAATPAEPPGPPPAAAAAAAAGASVDFLSASFDPLLALSTHGLHPPVPDAPTLDYLAKCRELLPPEVLKMIDESSGPEDAKVGPKGAVRAVIFCTGYLSNSVLAGRG